MKSKVKYTIILLCVLGFFFANFFDGEVPIKNVEDFNRWVITIGLVTYFFL